MNETPTLIKSFHITYYVKTIGIRYNSIKQKHRQNSFCISLTVYCINGQKYKYTSDRCHDIMNGKRLLESYFKHSTKSQNYMRSMRTLQVYHLSY